MRLNRFYSERKNLRLNSSVKLPDSDINHIRKVLRLKSDDQIVIFNGEKEYLAELKIVSNNFVTAKLIELLNVEEQDKDSLEVTIFQSLLKAGKFDYIVEKITELGITNIVPVESEFSQMKMDIAEKKIERWKKIAIAASKQSERIQVPEILPPLLLNELNDLYSQFDYILFFTVPRNNIHDSLKSIELKTFFKDKDLSKKKIAFFVGPEGGFSPREHEYAKANNFNFVKFGDTALRSETAAVAFLSIIKYIFNTQE